MKKILLKHETILGILIILVSSVIGIMNHSFFSLATLFDIIRGALPFLIMALGVTPVLIAGEIDISFVSVAAMSSFSTHMLLQKLGYQGGISLYLLIACAIGALAGLLLSFVVNCFKLPVFPVSLGFWMFWYGFNLYFLSPTINFNLPKGLIGYYSHYLLKVKDPIVGVKGLHVATLYLLFIGIFIWWVLKYTTIGRGLYAMGGNREAAIRAGYNVGKILRIALIIDGSLAAMAGVIHSALDRHFSPVLFRGQELYVIAAAVIGGVSITGGRGTVIGVVLGVFFLQIIRHGLIYLGVTAEYQQLVLGLTLLLFVTIMSLRDTRSLPEVFRRWFQNR